MIEIALAGDTDFEGWRSAARDLLRRGASPEEVSWSTKPGLFAAAGDTLDQAAPGPGGKSVPRAFLQLAEAVACHRSPERFALLYRLLWRLGETPHLLELTTDEDVGAANGMAKAVSRAVHKMKAFVRFRLIPGVEPETYVSWFEPAHHVERRTAPFFVDRFANMRFSILTPAVSLVWDGEALTFGPGATRADAPTADAFEGDWLAYYAAIFNPARLKPRAMQSEMPKRYWRNLPEAALIGPLMEQARERTRTMVDATPDPTRKRAPKSVESQNQQAVEADIDHCRRCDLWRDATQGVPGEGPADARLMLVGEQPGDQEDLAGKPFVGPAGQVLDRALREAGLDRGQLYVTNAVKHFKHELQGKRRLHKTPGAGEVTACRWWLDRERRSVAPRVIVALGATAARAVLGRAVPVMASRGKAVPLDDGSTCLVTIHPSFLLRMPDESAKAAAFADFVDDLRLARGTVESATD